MIRKRRPEILCGHCGLFGYRKDIVGRTHVRTIRGDACGGTWTVADVGHLKACPDCGTTGFSPAGRCASCDGRAWIVSWITAQAQPTLMENG